MTAARSLQCRFCGHEIYLAVCFDGRWRSFESTVLAPAPAGVWAFRRGCGMTETDTVPGHGLHFCAGHEHIGAAMPDLHGAR